MLQSSPQHFGSKPVVALLMHRLVVQQPFSPQHTWWWHRATQPQTHHTAAVHGQHLKPCCARDMTCARPTAAGMHGQGCCSQPSALRHTHTSHALHQFQDCCAHGRRLSCVNAPPPSQSLPAHTCPLGQHAGGSKGRVGMMQGSHSDLATSGRMTLRRTTAAAGSTAQHSTAQLSRGPSNSSCAANPSPAALTACRPAGV